MPKTPIRKRVLWIDDDSPKKEVKINDVYFHFAQNCNHGVQILKEEEFDFDYVIVDIVLAQKGWYDEFLLMPGIELVRHLKSTNPRLPVAVYSIFLDPERRSRAREAGADAVISKQEMGLKGVIEVLESAQTQLMT